MSGFVLRTGDLDRRVRIERKGAGTGFTSAGKDNWELVAETWAQVQDVLPSRAERFAEGLTIANRPARVRMRFRSDVNAGMRIVMGHNEVDGTGELQWHADRVMQIVAGPVELGRRVAIELMAEDYSTAGNAS